MPTETEPTHSQRMEAARAEWATIWQAILQEFPTTASGLTNHGNTNLVRAEILAWHAFLKAKGLE